MLHITRYEKLIQYYRANPPEGFVERHHILPRCMGGTDTLDNLILLPARAHFIVHYLLYKAYPENKSLAHAFAMMGVNNPHQRRSSRLYERSKLARSMALKGVPRPEWVKEKLRKPKNKTDNYRKPKTDEHRANIAASLRGKPKLPDAVKKSVDSKATFFLKKRQETEKRANYYRNLFVVSNVSRSAFYQMFPDVSVSTLKRYLKGL